MPTTTSITISLDLNSRLTNDLSNQLLITYSNIGDVRGSDSDKFPFIDIMKGSKDDGTQILEPYISAGYELFTWYNGVHNRVFTIKDDVTYFKGAHKITAGASMEYQFADNAYMREGTGYYRFKAAWVSPRRLLRRTSITRCFVTPLSLTL